LIHLLIDGLATEIGTASKIWNDHPDEITPNHREDILDWTEARKREKTNENGN
jgi:hypothetical protein